MADDDTFTYSLTIETTLHDSERYGVVLECLMDALVEASRSLADEKVPHQFQLRDTSMFTESLVLDLDRLGDV